MDSSIGLFEVKNRDLDAVPWNEIRETINTRFPFIIIRGVLSSEQIDTLVDIGQGFLDAHVEKPRRNEWGMPDTSRMEDSGLDPSIFRKKRIRMAHFFEWNETYAKLESLLSDAIAVREKIANFPPEKVRQIYVPIQFLHYPPGGGWLDRHQDNYVKTNVVLPDEEVDNHVVTISCTQKGVNFQEGGLYGDVEGRNVELESAIKKGDLIIFNHAVWHGVAPVDPQAKATTDLRTGKTTILIAPFPKSKLSGWPDRKPSA